MEKQAPAYKRVVLKLSGEALQERGARENISPAVVREIAERPTMAEMIGRLARLPPVTTPENPADIIREYRDRE